MVGGIKTRTLENDPNGLVNLFQGFFSTFRAANQWMVAERLLLFKLNAAVITMVNINRHGYFFLARINSSIRRVIIAHPIMMSKGR